MEPAAFLSLLAAYAEGMIGNQVKRHDLAYTELWLQAVGFCLLYRERT